MGAVKDQGQGEGVRVREVGKTLCFLTKLSAAEIVPDVAIMGSRTTA